MEMQMQWMSVYLIYEGFCIIGYSNEKLFWGNYIQLNCIINILIEKDGGQLISLCCG